mmetsp:Transcript_768/g.962  ORF Transcript_768/g.962 Transcript_768/m.962 type:complete len:272 (-) Transcript_768:33-848(-)
MSYFIPNPLLYNTPYPVSTGQPIAQDILSYSMHWCIKKGSKRVQQFWIYCEQSQDNFIHLELKLPEIRLSNASCLMIDEGGSLFIVEDIHCIGPYATVVPLFGATPQVIKFPLAFLSPCDPKKLTLKLSLVVDTEIPIHPLQGDPQNVQCRIEDVTKNYPKIIASPFDYMFCLNFQGRVEGWYKIQSEFQYDGKPLNKSFSDPFMFNNPRLKKLKEHKRFSTKELKFMQIFACTPQKREFVEKYGKPTKTIQNPQYLLEQAPQLFPVKYHS